MIFQTRGTPPGQEPSCDEAQSLLEGLASVFLGEPAQEATLLAKQGKLPRLLPNMDARYRTLVEQIPAVVFLVYLDQGIGEAYVSPYIEATLGFSQAEWLEDPVRWFHQLHPEDNVRWSIEAAEMFLTGKPLKSVYRVIARDGHVVWFHCEAKVVRRDTGEPWFIQGAGFDITDLKRAEQALQEERNFISTILDTVSTLILVLEPDGRVLHCNRAGEQLTGRSSTDVRGQYVWDQFVIPEQRLDFQRTVGRLLDDEPVSASFENQLPVKGGGSRLISWSGKTLGNADGSVRQVILTGVDITESKRLEKAILDIGANVERRIGQDLHDGLGQHLTGIAFMSKVLEQRLAAKSASESADAAKIVQLVNEAIRKTRELSRGLLPVVSDSRGLMSALDHLAAEVEGLFGIACRFQCVRPVLIYEEEVATHLYHIAQEAVNNAVKHGASKQIVISLGPTADGLVLTVRDDGRGLPAGVTNSTGMGLHIMQYRAKMIGGTLQIRRGSEGGTVISCAVERNQDNGNEEERL